MTVSVDTGGTFTDVVLQGPDVAIQHKLPSTPDDPARAVLAGVRAALKEAGLDPATLPAMIHGSTVATNALLERRGGRVAKPGVSRGACYAATDADK